jgi:hypothetical protein
MVAVSLLAMMSTLVFVAMRINFRAREQAYRIQSVYHQAEVSLNRMRRSISMAFISKHVDQDKSRKTLFKGSGDKLVFTYLGHQRMEPGVHESDQGAIEFYLGNDKENDGRALFLREKPVIDERPDKGGKVLKLAENVRELDFQYYDLKAEDWTDDWKAELADTDEAQAAAVAQQDRKVQAAVKAVETLTGQEEAEEFVLPKAVRIRLVLEDSEGNRYPFETAVPIEMRKAFDW